MYQTSAAYKTAVLKNDRVWQINADIRTAFSTYNLADPDIIKNTVSVKESVSVGNKFGIGSVVAADLSIALLNKNGRFDDEQFNGSVISPRVALEVTPGTYEWVPLGKFNVDDVMRPADAVSLMACDNMIFLDRPFFDVPIVFPCTAKILLSTVCQHCGVYLATTSFLHSDYVIKKRPEGDISCRDIVSYIAELAGCWARCNRYGQLELGWFTNPRYITEASIDGNTDNADGGSFDWWNNKSIDGGAFKSDIPIVGLSPSDRSGISLDDDPITITGIMLETDDTTYKVGSDLYAITISNNPLIQDDIETVLNELLDKLSGFTFMPFESDWYGDPALQAGDFIELIDRKGKHIRTIVTDSTYAYRDVCHISALGASKLTAGYKSPMTKKFSQLNRKIVEKQQQLDALDLAIQNATALISGALGGHTVNGDKLADEKYHGNIFICDNIGSDPANPDVTKAKRVWRWNLGGFGYSSTGINGPYTTAITADNSIVAAIITASMIKTGILQSLNGESWLDLDNGAFSFGDGALKWDATNGFEAVSAEKITNKASKDYYGIIGKGPKNTDGYGLFLVKNGTTTKDTYFRIYPDADGSVYIQQIYNGIVGGSVRFGANGSSASLNVGASECNISDNEVLITQKTSYDTYSKIVLDQNKMDFHLWQSWSQGSDIGFTIYKDRGGSKKIEFDIDGTVVAHIDSSGIHNN